MLSRDEFEVWVRSCHGLHTIFESRSDFYPISLQLVEEWWRNNGKYHINDEILKSLRSKLQYLDDKYYEHFGVKGDLQRILSSAFNEFISRHFTIGEHDNIGVAIAPYLFTWNLQRFKKYFMRNPQFKLSDYFIALGREVSMLKDKIAYFRGKRLIDSDIDSDEDRIRNLYYAIRRILKKLNIIYVGINENEYVGTVKILHILAPNYFPLLDNEIAKAVGLIKDKDQEYITWPKYITWIKGLRLWLQNYVDVLEKLENEFKSSMLKLIDESLYIMSTVTLSRRVPSLEIMGTIKN
jgi:hypothetical protein